MAKDRRNKVRPTMDLESDIQTGTSTDTGTTSRMPDRSTRRTDYPERRRKVSSDTASEAKRKRRRKKKLSRAALIIRWVIVVFVVVFLVFAGLLAKYIYEAMIVESGEKVPPIDPTPYDVTPVEKQSQVAYYLVGIFGEGESPDTSMLSVVCHDKQKNTVNILQLPQHTYIATGDQWSVDTLGKVYANPKALDWCNTCRKRLYEPEITEGDVATHTACGTEVTAKKGSAVTGLIDFVNDQLGLPVDDYFLMSTKTVAHLVNMVGGVDVDFGEEHYELAGTAFDGGVHTLPGEAAVEYITYTDGTIERDFVRMMRQRAVLGALLTRLIRMEKEAVREIFYDLMSSSIAIHCGESLESELRKDPALDEQDLTDTQYTAEKIVTILSLLNDCGTKNMTVQLLPGEATGDNPVYSVHKDELLTLLNTKFNPYSSGLSAADLLIPELANTVEADTQKVTLNTVVIEQTGKLLTEETE